MSRGWLPWEAARLLCGCGRAGAAAGSGLMAEGEGAHTGGC
ncbi:hypothetical protein KNP414_00867 [Paenibacillus mucilaginosus KNP414]|uniref:Uncharacterized protein n=1 Tax=Paenibacillus mucilaginosus (strain KNP414) TaxID=1036673 RepID=F8F4R5_PAEMK|nr:hypothetical protein KNP414_00867 [Paenibacillus mucilaginosus KNP414]